MSSFSSTKVHSSSSKKVKAPPRSEFVISMSIFVAITSMILAFDPEKRKLVMNLVTNYRFLAMLIAIFTFAVIHYFIWEERMKNQNVLEMLQNQV